jgi:hypothetical protein
MATMPNTPRENEISKLEEELKDAREKANIHREKARNGDEGLTNGITHGELAVTYVAKVRELERRIKALKQPQGIASNQRCQVNNGRRFCNQPAVALVSQPTRESKGQPAKQIPSYMCEHHAKQIESSNPNATITWL